MPTIRNPEDLSSLQSRFTRLTPASPAAWGKFTAPAMICHRGDSLRVALGEVQSPFVGTWLTRTIGKWLVINTPVRPPREKIETAPEMLLTAPASWPADQDRSRELLERASVMTTGSVHPGFGRLTPDQWGRLIWKHWDHHLRQFGV